MRKIAFILLCLISLPLMAGYKTDVISGLLGDLSMADYTVAFIFAGIGILIRTGIVTRNGVVDPTNDTPMKFSLSYWFWHNLPYKSFVVLLNVCIIFVSLRFPKDITEYIGMQWLSSMATNFYAFILGLLLDYIIDKMRKKSEAIRSGK